MSTGGDTALGRGAQVRLVDRGVELVEITASTPGAALIAAGNWLEQRHGTPHERLIESIGWRAPAGNLDHYELTLALTAWQAVDEPAPTGADTT